MKRLLLALCLQHTIFPFLSYGLHVRSFSRRALLSCSAPSQIGFSVAGFVTSVFFDLIEPQFVDASEINNNMRIFEVVPDATAALSPKLTSLNVRLQSCFLFLQEDPRISLLRLPHFIGLTLE